jgi:hypothetical protein
LTGAERGDASVGALPCTATATPTSRRWRMPPGLGPDARESAGSTRAKFTGACGIHELSYYVQGRGFRAPAFIMRQLLAAHSLIPLARPSLLALFALRWVVGGETMFIPGGAGRTVATATLPCSAHRHLSKGRSSSSIGLRPFAQPHPDALRPLSASLAVLAHNTRRYEHPSSGVSWPIRVGLC